MAIVLKEQEIDRKTKRRKPVRKRKLLLHEKVEVRSIEDGFLGSWHSGSVIAIDKQVRHVKYDHLLADNGSHNLVDIVDVSSIVDGSSCVNMNRCNYRGCLRPVPPPLEFGKWDLSYCLCVDVYYQEAWWEGVVFDHKDGLEERRIFFPDLGDEMTIGVGSMRITQDWNEFTETWHRRGTWLFLELIKEYEQEQYIPISVKQIWYDLREKLDFKKLEEWTSSSRALWENLVWQVIEDNLKITLNYFLSLQAPPSPSQQETQPMLEASKCSSCDDDNYPKGDCAETHAVVLVENPIDIVPSNLGSAVFHEDDGPFQDEVICVEPQGLPIVPSVEAVIAGGSYITKNDKMNNGRQRSLKAGNGRKWIPANSSIVPEAEFCPNAITEYALIGNKRARQTLLTDVKKHLKYMGWTFESSEGKEGILRQRYASPDGKHYFSLRQVCLDLMEKSDTESDYPGLQGDQRSFHTSSNNFLSPSVGHAVENRGFNDQLLPVASSSCDPCIAESEHRPQAVIEWSKIELKDPKKREKRCLKLEARGHLLTLGWEIANRMVKGRRMLQYISPSGKSFFSLQKACRSCVDRGDHEMASSTVGPVENADNREEVEDQLVNDKSTFATSNEETQKSAMQVNALSRSCSFNSFRISSSKKFSDYIGIKGRGIQKVRKRKRESLHLACHSCQKQDNSNTQNSIVQGRKGGKTQRTLIKVGDSLKFSRPTRVLRSSKRVQQVVTSGSPQNPRSILSWLIDNDVVLPRAKVHYRTKTDKYTRANGRITRDGIKCSCCGKVYSLSSFETHAGSNCRRPSANIFLLDGRSLLDCQRQAIGKNNMRSKSDLHPSLESRWHPGENDHICSICHYGGELILCDQCPSSFHKSCLGLKDIPDGDWFCPSCCCGICGQTKVEKETKTFKEAMALSCVQCQHKYHLGCLRRKGATRLEACGKGNWFCGEGCEKIFFCLHKLLGKPIPVGVENLTWTLMKPLQSDSCEFDVINTEALTENHSKLNIALDVMHECFEPVKEPHSQRDLVEDVIFARGSELSRLNFRGFYTVLLERDDELITVASLRVYGKKVAEIPLVGTRFAYRRLGMCRILMNELEKMLMDLGVERLVLPAVPSVLNTWTSSFGFSEMTNFERLKFVDYSFLDFQDTVMCQKTLTKSPSAELKVSRGNQSNNILRSGYSANLDRSTSILGVFQAEETEENRIMDNGLVETSAVCGSSGREHPLHLVDMTKQHSHIESKPCLDLINPECAIEDSDFSKEIGIERYAKCYKRRKVLNLHSISFSI